VVYQSYSGGSYPYCEITTGPSVNTQIAFGNGEFWVQRKLGRDMSRDPMVMVSWYGAAAYCNWLSAQQGRQECYDLSSWACDFGKNGYRLPTEAEWECAARGGFTGQWFPWGMTIMHSRANYYSSSSYWYDTSPTRGYHPMWGGDGIEPLTSPVGSFTANGYGLYDMSGNVWEWCNDWYWYIGSEPATNPRGPSSGDYSDRVVRGGAFHSIAEYCRVAHCNQNSPEYRDNGYGFRIVLNK